MNSTPDLKATEADDALVARTDERLAHAYEQIARADEQLARVTEQLSRMEHDAARHPSVLLAPKPSRGGTAVRGLAGLLLAACIAVAAFAVQSPYGDAIKLTISRWAPGLVSTASLPPEKSGLPAQPSASTVQVAAVGAAPPQATPSAPAIAQDVAPTVAPPSPDLAEMMQAMTRVLASVEQGVEQLKVRQEQMTSDNAKVVEQLRATQEQMARLVARTPENPAPRTSAPPPRPIAGAPKPISTRSSPQARAQPRTPVQLAPDEQ